MSEAARAIPSFWGSAGSMVENSRRKDAGDFRTDKLNAARFVLNVMVSPDKSMRWMDVISKLNDLIISLSMRRGGIIKLKFIREETGKSLFL
jgi:hypothetical protein